VSRTDNIDDLDLMQYADGEVDEAMAAEIAAHVAQSDDALLKLQALEQMNEVVRSSLELAADGAEPRLDAMWASIERAIQANGSTEAAHVAARHPQAAEPAGLLATIGRWLESYRAHFLTGAIAAGAAAIIILAARPDAPGKIIVQQPPVPTQTQGTLIKNEPSPPEIEHLEVNGGSSVFVIPSEGDNDVAATVIFVDMNDVEGPL
jgi:hypothetical protein